MSQSVQATLAPVRNSNEMEGVIAALSRESDGGLIVLPSAPITANIGAIIESAALHRVPTVYPFGSHARQGGLVAYGVELNDLFRRAAVYVDRILKGDKPADLRLQAPTKYDFLIKTAKELGLTIPATLLARADEVIE